MDELRAAGYRYDNDAACRGCGDPIEWWITPNDKKIPMNSMNKGTDAAVAHWSVCSDADSFRKKK